MDNQINIDDNHLIEEHYNDMLRSCTKMLSQEDLDYINLAFNFANDAHRGTKRKSGEPYILHPIAVAKIVSAEIGLGAKSIICALLHDVVEDTDHTIEEIERIFGKKIASIIEGLTKINSDFFDPDSSIQAENYRKLILSLADDIRVIIIKLADRLHNMRTLDSMPPAKQMKIASETIYLYAPLAHRLGLYAIKTELEDLSLKYRFPQIYQEISDQINANEKRRIQQINHFSLPIIHKLDENNIKFEINGRPKSIYSIWKKMQSKNVSFEEIYDLLAIRIVFDPYPHIPEKTQCWNIYSLVTDIYKPKPDRLRDWISTPKANGYEALHCTVMGVNGQWCEVQIRTRRMDEIAERGFAAHWKYKEMDTSNQENELDKWIKRVKETIDTTQDSATDFIDDFKMGLLVSEITVFTPKGDMRTLPKGATALDFAYDIHSGMGHQAIGAKVNHKLVPLSHVINMGDQIEIITASSQKPSLEMLNFVTTARAKVAIRNALKAETTQIIEDGKNILDKLLSDLGAKQDIDMLKKLFTAYEVNSKEELYTKIGMNQISTDNLSKTIKKGSNSRFVRYWKLQFGKNTAKDKSEANQFNIAASAETPTHITARCCNPIPGDKIIGYLSPDGVIILHKATCPEAVRLMAQYGDKIVNVKWTFKEELSFLAGIEIRGKDRMGMINEITEVITRQLLINISKFSIKSQSGEFSGDIEVYIQDSEHLKTLITNLMGIKGMISVKRKDQIED